VCRFEFRHRLVGAAMLGCLHLGESALAGPNVEDLALAKTEYVLKSPIFRTPEARERAISFIDKATESADEMSPEQFLLCMLRVAGENRLAAFMRKTSSISAEMRAWKEYEWS